MSTALVVLLLNGVMVVMSRTGQGFCGGHNGHGNRSNPEVRNSSKGCCGEHRKNNVRQLHGQDSERSEKTD